MRISNTEVCAFFMSVCVGDVKRKAGMRKHTERRSETKPCGAE